MKQNGALQPARLTLVDCCQQLQHTRKHRIAKGIIKRSAERGAETSRSAQNVSVRMRCSLPSDWTENLSSSPHLQSHLRVAASGKADTTHHTPGLWAKNPRANDTRISSDERGKGAPGATPPFRAHQPTPSALPGTWYMQWH